MNKRKFLGMIVIAAISVDCFAQQKTISGLCQFHSINNIALPEGQAGSSFQLETINGLQFKSCFVGAGIGLDYYRYRTIPLFIDLRKEFGKSTNKFFVYADGGVSYSWVTDKQKMPYVSDDKFKNGFYCDAGAGYKISVNKNNSLLLGMGYSFKKVEETNSAYVFNTGIGPFYNNEQRYDYSLNRLVIKIGWGF